MGPPKKEIALQRRMSRRFSFRFVCFEQQPFIPTSFQQTTGRVCDVRLEKLRLFPNADSNRLCTCGCNSFFAKVQSVAVALIRAVADPSPPPPASLREPPRPVLCLSVVGGQHEDNAPFLDLCFARRVATGVVNLLLPGVFTRLERECCVYPPLLAGSAHASVLKWGSARKAASRVRAYASGHLRLSAIVLALGSVDSSAGAVAVRPLGGRSVSCGGMRARVPLVLYGMPQRKSSRDHSQHVVEE